MLGGEPRTLKIGKADVHHVPQIGNIAVGQHDGHVQIPQGVVKRLRLEQTGHKHAFHVPVAQEGQQLVAFGNRPDHKEIPLLPQALFHGAG